MDTAQLKSTAEPTVTAVGPGLPPIVPLPPDAPPHKPTNPTTPSPAITTNFDAINASLDSPLLPHIYLPQDVSCCHQNADLTNCGAAAGEPCTWHEPGLEGTYHAERVADAAAASTRDGIKPTKEQFDEAAWDSDLF